MSSLRHLKAKSILLKISIFKSLSKIMPSPDIKKFETCLYRPSWQYRVNSFVSEVIFFILRKERLTAAYLTKPVTQQMQSHKYLLDNKMLISKGEKVNYLP